MRIQNLDLAQTELPQPKAGGGLDDAQRERLAHLYEANFAAVFTVCRSVLKSTEDAADAAHEVFIQSVDTIDVTASSARKRAWLLAVARNHCLDILRRRKRLSSVLTRLAVDANATSEPERSVVDRDTLRTVLRPLATRERRVLWQSAVEERPLAEIASHLGLSYMAAAQFVHRARRRAFLIAAKLAAIVAFYRSWLSRPRPNGSVTLSALMVAAAVPIFVATAMPSVTPQAGAGPAARSSASSPQVAGPVQVSIANGLPAAAVSSGTSAPTTDAPVGWAGLPARLPTLPGYQLVNGELSRVEAQLTGALPAAPPLPPPGLR
jgi:RNA polymerase sigma factor (sigma-70 family)